MDNIHQNDSNSKPILSISAICSKGCLNLAKHLRSCGFVKRSGASPLSIFMVLLTSIFAGAGTVHERFFITGAEFPRCSYDTLMRFVSNCRYKWSLLMMNIAKTACKLICSLNDKDHIYSLAIDDTVIPRACSKKVEGLSYIYDHVIGKCVKGYSNLLACWSDGFSNIPVVSELICSRKDTLKIRDFDKKIDHRTAGGVRRAHALSRKPELVINMCRSILNYGIKVQYVLMDTWFYSDALLASLNDLDLHSICMIKRNLLFRPLGYSTFISQKKILSDLYHSKSSKDIISSVNVESKSGQRFKLVFIRNRNNRSEFITLLTTDTSLSSEMIVELYSRRWSIESCFKATKQFLGLNSECYGRDFDTISALNRISYIRFIIMEMIRRYTEDMRSYGQIFRDCVDEIRTIPFLEALESFSRCFETFIERLKEEGCIAKRKLDKAYQIANEIIGGWYASINSFIANLLSPSLLPQLLKE